MSLTWTERHNRQQAARQRLQALELLPTPDHVADFLYLSGFRGVPRDPACCPVAEYLRYETGAGRCRVDTEYAQLYKYEGRLRLPAVVSQFVSQFDDQPDWRYRRLARRRRTRSV